VPGKQAGTGPHPPGKKSRRNGTRPSEKASAPMKKDDFAMIERPIKAATYASRSFPKP
jgi:hypothetical protein